MLHTPKIAESSAASPGEYNVHPMWYDVRQATKKMAHGVYEDSSGPSGNSLWWLVTGGCNYRS